MNNYRVAGCLAIGAVLCSTLASADAPSGGERWQVTTTMQMRGMAMPPRTTLVCADPARGDAPPVSTQKDCEIYDATRVGNTQSFKMRCAWNHPMNGSAQIVYSGDTYHGTMQMQMAQGDMAMTWDGRKLGRCDGTEANTHVRKALHPN
jgi:hypothetical protein